MPHQAQQAWTSRATQQAQKARSPQFLRLVPPSVGSLTRFATSSFLRAWRASSAGDILRALLLRSSRSEPSLSTTGKPRSRAACTAVAGTAEREAERERAGLRLATGVLHIDDMSSSELVMLARPIRASSWSFNALGALRLCGSLCGNFGGGGNSRSWRIEHSSANGVTGAAGGAGTAGGLGGCGAPQIGRAHV